MKVEAYKYSYPKGTTIIPVPKELQNCPFEAIFMKSSCQDEQPKSKSNPTLKGLS